MSRTQTASPKGSNADPRLVNLSANGIEIEIDPRRGARINAATYRGHPVLHPRQDRSDPNPLDAGCFPLVPFSNRIRNGRFEFEGVDHQVRRNWEGDAHSIHGEGWIQPWTVLRQTDHDVSLGLTGTPWWPWRYACKYTIRISGQSIELSLDLKNVDTRVMPAGLGFHPYFQHTPSTLLAFTAEAAWPPLAQASPQARPLTDMTDFRGGRTLQSVSLDHCYSGWDGRARIIQPDAGLSVDIEANTGACVVFVPRNAGFFCFEPVSHVSGAFELDASEKYGLQALTPGETMQSVMTLHLSANS